MPFYGEKKKKGLLMHFFLGSQVSGRALKDSVRIATKFSDMEETYSSQNIVRFVEYSSHHYR